MKSQAKYLFLILLGLTIGNGAQAQDDGHARSNDCGRLHIQIGNATPLKCQLITSKQVHGKLISSPPAMIPPGFSGRFDMYQTFYGPEIVLEYSCEGETISFVTQQNYCFMKAGQLSAKVLSSSPRLKASYTAERGSYYWGQPGIVNWVINSTEV